MSKLKDLSTPTENELCNVLISHAQQFGFRHHAEYSDWDLVLSRGKLVIGVEAKLKRNMHLLVQLSQKNNVHLKVALLPLSFVVRDKTVDDFKFLCRKLRIIPVLVQSDRNLIVEINKRDLFYYRWKPKNLLKLPEFDYENKAGVKAPRKVSERNISLVQLEFFARKRNGFVSLAEIRAFGFDRAPWCFDYNWTYHLWQLGPEFRWPSKQFPHIAKGILEHEKSKI